MVTLGSPMAQVRSQGRWYILIFKVLSNIKFKRRNNGAVNVKQCTWEWILVSSCWRTSRESWAAAAEHSLGSERGRQRREFQQLKGGWRAAAETGMYVMLHAETVGCAAAEFSMEHSFSHEYSFIHCISSKGFGSATSQDPV